ncbi:hypothetical protein BRADI_5g06554v3 [Brachypodium distachyon]|uniref:Uncharacterized protein n=1 Tax=Brachypodium distachyon TaxID=15368 RepID=A0A2K2CFM6_BRADI|nr:hypothetical protein BRADI_5g06554v3 [Brachypodium distachyon]
MRQNHHGHRLGRRNRPTQRIWQHQPWSWHGRDLPGPERACGTEDAATHQLRGSHHVRRWQPQIWRHQQPDPAMRGMDPALPCPDGLRGPLVPWCRPSPPAACTTDVASCRPKMREICPAATILGLARLCQHVLRRLGFPPCRQRRATRGREVFLKGVLDFQFC